MGLLENEEDIQNKFFIKILFFRKFCLNYKDHLNVTSSLDDTIQKCLMQSSFLQYSIVSNDVASFPLQDLKDSYSGVFDKLIKPNNSLLEINLKIPSNIQTVHEEVLILDEIALLGYLGGSLGLFIGFSLFGYISTAFDAFFDACIKKE